MAGGWSSVGAEELRKVPYISYIPSKEDGRSVFLQPYFDKSDNKWKMFIPRGPKLICSFAEPAESGYFAETIADPRQDIYMSIADIVTRHYSYMPAMTLLLRIIAQILFSAALVDKYILSLARYRITKDPHVAKIVVTDIEYLFTNARSTYNHTQALFAFLWALKTGKSMPTSFRKVVQKTEEELRTQYSLPSPMIQYYGSSKVFFGKMRAIRDTIIHYPEYGALPPPEHALCFDDGFAVFKGGMTQGSLSLDFDIWPPEKVKPNGLVSVLALIAYVNKMLLQNCDAFTGALMETIPPPVAISESHKLFMRSPYIHHLLKTDDYLREQWIEGDLGSKLTQSAS